MYPWIYTLMMLFCTYAHAQQTLWGRATDILDGDTFVLLDTTNTKHKVRLLGIDAPESGQVCDTASKACLMQLIYGKEVCVEYKNNDRYRRILGQVFAGDCIVNEAMLLSGYAWAYVEYLDKSNRHYTTIEANARRARLGLWVDPQAQAPWAYRE